MSVQSAVAVWGPIFNYSIGDVALRCARVTLFTDLLAPRHIIYTALEGALLDARGSFAESEEALAELERRHVPLVLVTSRTREEMDPLRRSMGHSHPFIGESGGAIYFPDGYFNVKIPDVKRSGRYLCLAFGRPYEEVCEGLDDVAEESGVGVAGFHHMSTREIAENTGLRQKEAELARRREFEEPFFFTSADEKSIERFVAAAKEHGFDARPGKTFWHFSAGCDSARAVRSLTKIFREATRTRLRSVGIGPTEENLPWLQAVDQKFLLGKQDLEHKDHHADDSNEAVSDESANLDASWSATVINIIS